jgi:hypothetical protein
LVLGFYPLQLEKVFRGAASVAGRIGLPGLLCLGDSPAKVWVCLLWLGVSILLSGV